jgi:hypothetical protein
MNQATKLFAGSYLLILVIFLVGRYGALPDVGYTLDDWWHLNLASSYDAAGSLANDAVRYPMRPLHALIYMVSYRVFGEQAEGFVALGAVCYALFLLLAMLLTRTLTGSDRAALLLGLLCAIWPGYHEMFFWPTVMLYSVWSLTFALLLFTWGRFIEEQRISLYILSVLLYGTLIAMYEIYLPVPAALAMLIPWNRKWLVKAFSLMLPFAAMAAFYLTFRFTYAFGYGVNIFGTDASTASAFAANFWEIRHNAMNIASWFAGFEAGRIWLDGLAGIRQAGTLHILILVLANSGLAYLFWRRFRKPEQLATCRFLPIQVAACGLVLAIFVALILVLTYPVGRNMFPFAVGLFLVLSLSGRVPWKHSSWVVPLLAFTMLSTQGMGKNWEAVARIQEHFRSYLSSHREQWAGKELVLVDTRALRERMRDLGDEDLREGFFALVEYRSAGFLRGFGPAQILARVAGKGVPHPRVLLDVEHGAILRGGELVWHERFNPDDKRATTLDQVYIVDVLKCGGE